jgi:hypothetical protein
MLLLNRNFNVKTTAKNYNIKSFHVSKFLSSEKDKTLTINNTDTILEVDSDKLIKSLEDLRNSSWEKSTSDVLAE